MSPIVRDSSERFGGGEVMLPARRLVGNVVNAAVVA
jgi:hypothetical protein